MSIFGKDIEGVAFHCARNENVPLWVRVQDRISPTFRKGVEARVKECERVYGKCPEGCQWKGLLRNYGGVERG